MAAASTCQTPVPLTSEGSVHGEKKSNEFVASVTPASLREKAKAGSPVTISELILVYRRHMHE
jgi:hypothetical protein